MILVFGFYGRNNLGDELFKEAFINLFPTLSFKFVSELNLSDIEEASAIFFGGGSFLSHSPRLSDVALTQIKKKPIFYLGVGSETQIDPQHQQLMSVAKLIAVRNKEIAKIRRLNPNTMAIPDLVYLLSRHLTLPIRAPSQDILFIPNTYVVPLYLDAHWKHASWNYFKSEISQVLDELSQKQIKTHFFPMSSNHKLNDHWAAIEILNQTQSKSDQLLLPPITNFENVIQLFSQYKLIITQRYHGAILAQIAQVPHLIISHHDKLSTYYPATQGTILPYYGINKAILSTNIDNYLGEHNKLDFLPIDFNIFDRVRDLILEHLRT